MTRDDIIRMAKEADEYTDMVLSLGERHPDWHDVRDEKFAELVTAAEREECARVAEKFLFAGRVAKAIRARGEK